MDTTYCTSSSCSLCLSVTYRRLSPRREARSSLGGSMGGFIPAARSLVDSGDSEQLAHMVLNLHTCELRFVASRRPPFHVVFVAAQISKQLLEVSFGMRVSTHLNVLARARTHDVQQRQQRAPPSDGLEHTGYLQFVEDVRPHLVGVQRLLVPGILSWLVHVPLFPVNRAKLSTPSVTFLSYGPSRNTCRRFCPFLHRSRSRQTSHTKRSRTCCRGAFSSTHLEPCCGAGSALPLWTLRPWCCTREAGPLLQILGATIVTILWSLFPAARERRLLGFRLLRARQSPRRGLLIALGHECTHLIVGLFVLGLLGQLLSPLFRSFFLRPPVVRHDVSYMF